MKRSLRLSHDIRRCYVVKSSLVLMIFQLFVSSYSDIIYQSFLLIPSNNQTWQWKILHL